jgi:AbiV family abortive infection protein
MVKKSQNPKIMPIVSSDKILIGMFFALRQSWELLSSARVLHEAEKFSAAYGLAVFCREEIGKSKILEKHWQASTAGQPVSVSDLNTGEMRSHSKKLRAVGKVLSEGVISQGTPPNPGSPEADEEFRHIHEINVRARALDPDRTHLGRQRAFYVEMHETAVGWWKPWTQFDRTRSRGEILEAECVYLFRRSELELLKEKVSAADFELGNSLHLPPELGPGG